MNVARLTALLILISGSAACDYHNTIQPAAAEVDASKPFQITLSTTASGTVSSATNITAHVTNVNGAALNNVVVTFATSVGVITPDAATTNAGGSATTTLVAADIADITAVAGTLSAHTILVPVAPSPVAPTPTPPPAPPPPPPSPLPVAFLNVSSGGTTGVPLAFSVSSSAAEVNWVWSFGDGSAPFTTTAFSTTHTYSSAGSYTATVSSDKTSSASSTISITDPVARR